MAMVNDLGVVPNSFDFAHRNTTHHVFSFSIIKITTLNSVV